MQFYTSGHIFLIACHARNAAIHKAANGNDSPMDATVALMMAAAAAEGFINEIPVVMKVESDMMGVHDPKIVHFCEVSRSLEDSRATTQLKFLMASILFSGQVFDSGKNPLQDFELLFKLRNELMHLKVVDQKPDAQGEVVSYPKSVRTLQQRGLAHNNPSVGRAWVNALQTPGVAQWSCQTAANMMLAVLDMIPQTTLNLTKKMGDTIKIALAYTGEKEEPKFIQSS